MIYLPLSQSKLRNCSEEKVEALLKQCIKSIKPSIPYTTPSVPISKPSIPTSVPSKPSIPSIIPSVPSIPSRTPSIPSYPSVPSIPPSIPSRPPSYPSIPSRPPRYPTKIILPPPSRPYSILKPVRYKPKRYGNIFTSEIRRFGVWKAVTGPTTYREAYAKGVRRAKRTLGVSVRVKRAGKIIKVPTPKGFRVGKKEPYVIMEKETQIKEISIW